MKPTDQLIHEHKIILMVMEAVERHVSQIGKGAKPDLETLSKVLDFFRAFIDRCHHAKEEKHLFPILSQRGVPVEGGPIGVMLHEHQEGRQHVKRFAEALEKLSRGDASAQRPLLESATGYAALLRSHIAKEDGVLFPLADRVLTPADQEKLAEAFEKLEAEEMGEGVHEKYHQLAHDLAASWQ